MRITVPEGHVRPLEWFYSHSQPCPRCGAEMEGEATLSENSVYCTCACGGVQVVVAPRSERKVVPFLRGKALGHD